MRYFFILFFLISTSALPAQTINSVTKKVVKKAGVLQAADVDALGVGEVEEVRGYVDGLGRPLQEVQRGLSPLGKDVVTHHVYDDRSAELRSHLPYVRTVSDGAYRAFSATELSAFYQQANDGIANTAYPYSENVIEASPLARPLEQSAAGEAWRLGAGHTTRLGYGSNTSADAVLRWRKTTTGFSATAGYSAGELSTSETTDPNGRLGRQYKDKDDKVILNETIGDNGMLRTYYVFNDLHQLVGVIPPQTVKDAGTALPVTIPTATVDKACYQYSYDHRGRQIKKRIPGAAETYMVYDSWDRLVLTQDGNQRAANKWNYIKYDALDRAVITGEVMLTGDQAALTTAVNTFYATVGSNPALRYEAPGTAQHGYTNRSYPVLVASSTVNTVQYHDDYAFLTGTAGRYALRPDATLGLTNYFARTNGLATGGKVRVLNSSPAQYLITVNYYDNRYRVLQTLSDNQFGNLDSHTTQYDFTGKAIKNKQVHTGLETITQTMDFEYDHHDRLVRTYHQMGTDPRVLLSEQHHNELGQLVEKDIHTVTGQQPFQSVDYEYNIRGWVGSMNKSGTTAEPTRYSDLYTFSLSYDEPVAGITNTPQYNGNISAFSQGRPQEQDALGTFTSVYAHSYDTRDQLKASTYHQPSNPLKNGLYNEALSYDYNGNITALQRQGADATGTATQLDNLQYTYINTNQLQRVQDNGDATLGFKDANTGTATDYTYDANGNMISDLNKGISSIKYNHLNLVEEVTFSDSRKIKYSYTGSGEKLKQEVYSATGTLLQKRQYSKGILYKDGLLQEVPHGEGRIVHQTLGQPSSPWVYEYHLKDHLGNVRTTFTTQETTQASQATLETQNAAGEQDKFLYYGEAVKVNSILFDHTKSGLTHYSTRLNGTASERTGLARSISVMPGDKVTAEVFAKYVDTNKANWTGVLNTFMTAIATGTAPTGTVIDGGLAGSTGGTTAPFSNMLDKGNETGTAPKAYLNYLVFDREYLLQDAGFVRVSEAAREYGQDGLHERLYKEIPIKKAGYVYLYLSNDNAALGGQNVEAYFDDFTVTQLLSPVVETTDYYPFGLTAATQRREGGTDQPFKYNGKELQENGLDWYDYGARMYDAAIARWHVIDPLAEKDFQKSPYNYVGNNPLLFVDPDGRLKFKINGEIVFAPVEVRTMIVASNDRTSKTDRVVTWGFVYADDGTPIIATKNDAGDLNEKPVDPGWDTDCHGSTFARGQVWINDGEVGKILIGDGYTPHKKNDLARPGDIVIFRDSNDNIVHSVTISDIKNGNIYVKGQAGLEEKDHVDNLKNLQSAWKGTSIEGYRKRGGYWRILMEKYHPGGLWDALAEHYYGNNAPISSESN